MKGWLLATIDGKKVGIIPANYVKVLGKKRGSRAQNQIQTSQSQPAFSPAQRSEVTPMPLQPIKEVQFAENELEVPSGVETVQSGGEKSCCGGKGSVTNTDQSAGDNVMAPNSLESEFQNLHSYDPVTLDNKGPAQMDAEEILDASKSEFD